MKALIGVIPEQVLRKRMLAIASGRYQPAADEPKVWFASVNAIGQILSNENIALLRLMAEQQPESISALARLSGRQVSNLSVTLKTMGGYGFVHLEKRGNSIKPRALYTDFEIRIDSIWMSDDNAA